MKNTNKYKPINMGIFAHVDAGKTTITENILYKTNVIKHIGRVDNGNTQTDSLEVERRRGISIRSATTSFYIDDIKVNLIDTPGHIDFISEVERAINILDCAILVISGKEGVQAQTKVLWNALQSLKVPTIIFINKLDRLGADHNEVLSDIKEHLSNRLIIMQDIDRNNDDLKVIPRNVKDDAIQVLVDLDDDLLEKYLDEQVIYDDEINEKLHNYIFQAKCFPVYSGSALKDIGCTELITGIKDYLLIKNNNKRDELSGVVFKIDKDSKDERIVYIRLFGGTLKNRSIIDIYPQNHQLKIKKLKSIINGKMVDVDEVTDGDIAVVYGLNGIEIGDIIGNKPAELNEYSIPKTTLTSKITPNNPSQKNELVYALTELSEQDPLLNFRVNSMSNELSVNLIGQIQMEVIKTMLIEKYNIDTTLSNPEVIYKETPINIGTGYERYHKNHPYPAEIAFTISPLPRGSGLQYKSNVSYGYIIKSFQKAVEEAVFDIAKEGLFGWEVTDCLVTFTDAYFNSVDSTPSAFRSLTPIVFMEALNIAKTKLLEPINFFTLTISEDEIGKCIHDLEKMRATYEQPIFVDNKVIIKGEVPVSTSFNYRLELATNTKGKGVFETVFSGYKEAYLSTPKTRERSFVSPLKRSFYLKALKGVMDKAL